MKALSITIITITLFIFFFFLANLFTDPYTILVSKDGTAVKVIPG